MKKTYSDQLAASVSGIESAINEMLRVVDAQRSVYNAAVAAEANICTAIRSRLLNDARAVHARAEAMRSQAASMDEDQAEANRQLVRAISAGSESSIAEMQKRYQEIDAKKAALIEQAAGLDSMFIEITAEEKEQADTAAEAVRDLHSEFYNETWHARAQIEKMHIDDSIVFIGHGVDGLSRSGPYQRLMDLVNQNLNVGQMAAVDSPVNARPAM